MENSIVTSANSALLEAIKRADRIDRYLTVKTEDGRVIDVLSSKKYCYDHETKSGHSEWYVKTRPHQSRGWGYFSQKVETFLAEYPNMEIEEERITPKELPVETILELVSSRFDAEEYAKDIENYEDEYGRCYDCGSDSCEVEIDDDDYYVSFTADISIRTWYYPQTYWEPEDSGFEITELRLFDIKAVRIDEDGEEHELSEAEMQQFVDGLKSEHEIIPKKRKVRV